jgi:hypothetical protein
MYMEKMSTTSNAPIRTTMMMAMLGLNLLLTLGGGTLGGPLGELIVRIPPPLHASSPTSATMMI